MESVSYDRFTTPEAEINHTGQKFLLESGEKRVYERNVYKLCFVENIDSKLRINLSCHLT